METLLALVVFTAAAVYLTWPVAAHLSSTIYISPDRPFGDQTGSIAALRELVEGTHNPFAAGRLADLNAPHGAPIAWAINVASFPRFIFLYPAAAAFGATAAYGLFTILGFIASATAMFLLVRWLTGSALAGLVAGFAMGFFPFPAANGEHPDFLHTWPLVLLAWRMIVLAERPDLRNGVWAGLAAVLAVAWTPYYILLGGVMFAGLATGGLALAARRARLRAAIGPHLVAGGLLIAWLLAMVALAAADTGTSEVRPNLLSYVVDSSARPLNYVLPPPWSPLLGDLLGHLVEERGWDNGEKTLYVGISLIVLAAIGLLAAATRRLPPRLASVALLMAATAVLAMAFSGPPEVRLLGTNLPLPSRLGFELSSGFRVYSRFVLIVMLALCVLAAFGVMALRGLSRPRVRSAAVALAVALVVADVWGHFEPSTRDIAVPGIYRVLREQPAGLVAQYPIRSSEAGGDYRELFFQDAHDKPILNGAPARSDDEEAAIDLSVLDRFRTVNKLATLGIRYVVVERRPFGARRARVPGSGLRRLAGDSFADLYRVTAAPIPVVQPAGGLSIRFGPVDSGFRMVDSAEALLRIVAPCDACSGALRFTIQGVDYERRLEFTDERGRRLVRARISPLPRRFRIDLRFHRRTIVRLRVTPGPTRVSTLPGVTRASATLHGPRFDLHERR